MGEMTKFIQMVEDICTRRKMFATGGTFYEVCAYLTGYAEASTDSPLSNEGWKVFSQYVCAHFRFPDKYV